MMTNKPVIVECEQRSDKWRWARLGRLTASRAADALASPLKGGGEPARRRDYRMQLVAERLSGQPQEAVFVNDAMQWGIDHEDEAIAAYEALTGRVVMPVGFIRWDDLMVGCSPDGLVDDGLVSIKCPKTATFIAYLAAGVVPGDYLPQILCEMWITGAKWVDFCAHDPRLPESLRNFVVRYERDESQIEAFEAQALKFLGEVDQAEADIRTWGERNGRT